MNALQQKAAYVANITGLDIAAESSGDAEKQSRIYLNVSCGDVSGRISLPGDSSPQLVGLSRHILPIPTNTKADCCLRDCTEY